MREDDNLESSKRRGVQALLGAVVAVVGALAAANPQSVWLRALNQAVPDLAGAVPALITGCGALIAAFSNPPSLNR